MAVNDGYAFARAGAVTLLAYYTARVHAKGADFIFKRIRIIYKFCFVKAFCKLIHNGVGDFDAHADVYFVVRCFKAVFSRNA